MKTLLKSAVVFIVLVFMSGIVPAAEQVKKQGFKPFYIYSDQASMANHFAPSGWMGDVSDIKCEFGCVNNTKSGKTCIRVTYDAKMSLKEEWAGIYWQFPANNWGKRKGYDLTGSKKLTLWVRGEKGGEKLSVLKVGGITGGISDSCSVEIGPEVLSKDWTQLTINLEGKNMTNIMGGFCFVVSREDNPMGCVFYLDEIVFE